jgi:Domain of unknown function (DUF5753)/Helix-turn-helix domain
MPARKQPTVPQRALAAALERCRVEAGLGREDVSRALEWSAVKPYRIETARVTVSLADVRVMAQLYGLDGAHTERLLELARQARKPGWWAGMAQALPSGFSVHLELESTARAIRTFEAQYVPGLFQTEDYAHALLRARSVSSTPEQVERQVVVRMRRQEVVLSRGLQIWAILDEGAIRRMVGGRDVMRRQLGRIHDVAARPNVTIQVLPFSAGAHMAAYGSFSLFEPSEDLYPVTASTDRPGGTLIEDDPLDIDRYTLIFNHLRTTALDSSGSRDLVGEIMRSL